MATDFLEFVSAGGSDGRGEEGRAAHGCAWWGIDERDGNNECDARMADDNGGPCLLYDYIALPQKRYDSCFECRRPFFFFLPPGLEPFVRSRACDVPRIMGLFARLRSECEDFRTRRTSRRIALVSPTASACRGARRARPQAQMAARHSAPRNR
jgi:hypothetical protein